MTILNSAANFGGMWPESTGKSIQKTSFLNHKTVKSHVVSIITSSKLAALWLIDHLGANPINATLNKTQIESGEQDLNAYMAWDPYYGLNTALVIIGIIQLIIYRPRLKYLDSLSRSLWRVRENETSTAVYEKLLNDE